MLRTRVVVRAATLAIAVAAAVAVPAAQATVPPIKAFPKIFRNGVKLNTTHVPIITYGSITLDNRNIGNVTCQTMMFGEAWNEMTEKTEKGLANITQFSTSPQCKAVEPCMTKNTKGEEAEGVFLTAEAPPIKSGTEVFPSSVFTVPWTAELIEREEGVRQLLMHHLKIWVVFPPGGIGSGPGCVGAEIPFEENETEGGKEEGYEPAPIWGNGTKNGLKPSHMESLGEAGLTEKKFPRTGRLSSGGLFGDGFLTATRVIPIGATGGNELITAE